LGGIVSHKRQSFGYLLVMTRGKNKKQAQIATRSAALLREAKMQLMKVINTVNAWQMEKNASKIGEQQFLTLGAS
jgi:hypothetical protein